MPEDPCCTVLSFMRHTDMQTTVNVHILSPRHVTGASATFLRLASESTDVVLLQTSSGLPTMRSDARTGVLIHANHGSDLHRRLTGIHHIPPGLVI